MINYQVNILELLIDYITGSIATSLKKPQENKMSSVGTVKQDRGLQHWIKLIYQAQMCSSLVLTQYMWAVYFWRTHGRRFIGVKKEIRRVYSWIRVASIQAFCLLLRHIVQVI